MTDLPDRLTRLENRVAQLETDLARARRDAGSLRLFIALTIALQAQDRPDLVDGLEDVGVVLNPPEGPSSDYAAVAPMVSLIRDLQAAAREAALD